MTGGGTTDDGLVPRTILARGERLAESKRALARGDASIRATYLMLLDSARVALAATPVSVTQKKRTPPSGDKHDYMSLAPYYDPGFARDLQHLPVELRRTNFSRFSFPGLP